MKNYKDLQMDFMYARKERNELKTKLFSTLIAEVELETKRSGKDHEDIFEGIAVKFRKNLQETYDVSQNIDTKLEIELVNQFLPEELSEGDIRTIVQNMIDLHGKDMKVLMPALKAIKGMNMKIASQIVRES